MFKRLILNLTLAIGLLLSLASCPPGPSELVSYQGASSLVPVFGGRKFERPIFLTHAPGGGSELYVAEQSGLVYRFAEANSQSSIDFIDIRNLVSRAGNEEGLLGLAFHPKFAENGKLYLHYSKANPREGIISEFQLRPGKDTIDPSTERIILRQPQPYSNHNGGSIEFGPDGYLYISFGDGGSAGDPENRSQDFETLLGKILRIDVDSRSKDLEYGIPSDNPFVDKQGARAEIWALGLRNTYRFSFDSVTGKMWGGDVGQYRREEINIIRKGGNYGWKRFEGKEFYSFTSLTSSPALPPVTTYRRNDGYSVTGGYVYRGAKILQWQGIYLFADYGTGRLWGLWPMGRGQYQSRKLMDTYLRISSFGEDAQGEIYLCAFGECVYRLDPTTVESGSASHLPDELTTAEFFKRKADWQPYQVASPLWSDGLRKKRFVLLPPNSAPIAAANGRFDLDDETYLIKEFSYHRGGVEKIIETRVIVKLNGKFHATSYKWDELGETAQRCDEVVRVTWPSPKGPSSWNVPSPSQCHQCHIGQDDFLLGFKPSQLAANGELNRLQKARVIAPSTQIENGIPLVDPSNKASSIALRARSYLHANCANCHQPNGPGNSPIDLRMGITIQNSKMLNADAHHGMFGVENAKIIVPGKPEQSVVLHRMSHRGIGHMPPLGSSLVDDAGMALVRQWILEMK